MKIAAVIAEFNPFHNGHRYLLEETRAKTGADFILALMSGNFVQRGAPAFADKYLRTKTALLGGADAVLELPALYATSSAEFFAGGAVTLLNHLNIVDFLAFGSESGDLSLLEECAHMLVSEDRPIRDQLASSLREGCSYPLARMKAAIELSSLPKSCSPETLEELFSAPNNILGLEYCKMLTISQSSIRPFTIARKGNAYHDDSLSDRTGSRCTSATAIRKVLAADPRAAAQYMPTQVFRVLSEDALYTRHLTEDDFSGLLHYRLLLGKDRGFQEYLDCTPDLSDKIIKSIPLFTTFSEFCRLLKSKELTYSRISRVLTHILLDIKTPEYFLPVLSERKLPTPYARLLGFCKSASPLLAAIRENSSIPLISKTADARYLLDEQGLRLLQTDIRCGSVYALAAAEAGKPIRNEIKQPPVILP